MCHGWCLHAERPFLTRTLTRNGTVYIWLQEERGWSRGALKEASSLFTAACRPTPFPCAMETKESEPPVRHTNFARPTFELRALCSDTLIDTLLRVSPEVALRTRCTLGRRPHPCSSTEVGRRRGRPRPRLSRARAGGEGGRLEPRAHTHRRTACAAAAAGGTVKHQASGARWKAKRGEKTPCR